jgi:hypothetical protein
MFPRPVLDSRKSATPLDDERPVGHSGYDRHPAAQ